MSGIYISGMEMPKDAPLRIVLNPKGQLFVDHGTWFVEYEAIPVPEHGDLIDRKVALDSLLNGMVMTGYQSRAMDCVGEWYVPTIIPAKEGVGK